MTLKEIARQAAVDKAADLVGGHDLVEVSDVSQVADAVAVAVLTATLDNVRAQAERIQPDASPDYRAGEAFALEYAALGIQDLLAECAPAAPLGTGIADDWRSAALRLGERLAPNGPDSYYRLTPLEWLNWALQAVAPAAPPGTTEPRTAADEIPGYADMMKALAAELAPETETPP